MFWVLLTLVHASNIQVKVLPKNTSEQRERNVDRAALASQKTAIEKLNKLYDSAKGSVREPTFLFKLGELHNQMAAIQFRLAYGKAHASGKLVNLSDYKQSHKSSIFYFDQLISKHSDYFEIARAYYMRGKAHEELENKPLAIKDYLKVVKDYLDLPESVSALMSLAEFAIGDLQYQRAVGFLETVEKEKNETAFYPFALYKLAWCHYNLKNIPKALSYLEKHIKLYDAQKSRDDFLSTSDQSIRENSLMDMTLFYMDGFELNPSQYTIENALEFFRKFETGPKLGPMSLRFAKLLKAHAHDKELAKWRNLIVKNEAARPESFDVVSTALEYQFAKKDFPALVETSKDLAVLYHRDPQWAKKLENYQNSLKLVTDYAKQLQALTIKNKGAKKISFLSKSLVGLLTVFTEMVDEQDPRIHAAHYNLAETLFEIKDFEDAATHYRWIVAHYNPFKKDQPVKIETASLKAIASRYEHLREKGIIPESLKPMNISKDSGEPAPDLLTDWLMWVDQHKIDYYLKKGIPSSREFQNFEFEGARALYFHQRMRPALTRMLQFARVNPKSEFTPSLLSLALDTYVQSQMWEDSFELTNEWIDKTEIKDVAFKSKLATLAADSFLKMAEIKFKAQKYAEARDSAQKFLRLFPNNKRASDALYFSAQSSQALGDENQTLAAMTKLIESHPNSVHAAGAMLAQASIFETRLAFDEAASSLEKYLLLPKTSRKTSEKEENEIRKKIFHYAYVSGRESQVRKMLADPLYCANEALIERCQIVAAIYHFISGREPLLANSAKKENILNPMIELSIQPDMKLSDRFKALKNLVSTWKKTDPQDQIAILDKVVNLVEDSLEKSSAELSVVGKLKPTESAIKKRVGLIKEFENIASEMTKLEWVRIKAIALHEVANAYVNFTKELSSLPPPKDLPDTEKPGYEKTIRELVVPFEEKAQDIRFKAFMMASQFSIEPKPYQKIFSRFIDENPSQGKAIKPELAFSELDDFNLKAVKRMDSGLDFQKHLAPFEESFKKKNIPGMLFYLSEAEKHNELSKYSHALLQASVLMVSGARGEALIQFEKTKSLAKETEQAKLGMFLINHAVSTLSKERTRSLIESLQDSHFKENLKDVAIGERDSFNLAQGAVWSQAQITTINRQGILMDAYRQSFGARKNWAAKQQGMTEESATKKTQGKK